MPVVSLADAQKVVRASIDAAQALGRDVVVTVCDTAGHVVASARMDGAPLLSIDLAADKAWSVVAFHGLPTASWRSIVADDPLLMSSLVARPRLVLIGGGVPLRLDGVLIGAIGVSGGSVDDDELIAAAGLAALGEPLS